MTKEFIFRCGILAWAILWILGWLMGLPKIEIPFVATFAAIFIFIVGICASSYAGYWLSQFGRSSSKTSLRTTVLVTAGPYRVVRHPMIIGSMLMLAVLPVILYFTILVIPADIILIVSSIATCIEEEKECIAKFGEKYRQYMKEVPRFNFLKGLINLRK